MATLKELDAQLTEKRVELKKLFDEHKTDDGFNFTPEQLEEVNRRNDELNELHDDYEEAKKADEIYQRHVAELKAERQPAQHLPFNGGSDRPKRETVKSIADRFVESKAYQRWKNGGARPEFSDDSVDMKQVLQGLRYKTTITTSAGWAPENLRIPRVIEDAQRMPMIQDFIPQTTTTQAAVVYMEETTFANSADTRAENSALPESALGWTEQSDTLRKIGTFIPVTDEQLEDVPQIQSVINNRLTLMLEQTEEDQIVSGSGTAPDLTGFLNKTGVQTQALGADTVPDAVYKALTLVRHTGRANPNAVIFHPNDWQDVRLLRTTDGIYIWGSPAEAGPERIWGLPVVSTTAMTENTALTGDFQLYSELYRKMGVTIKVTDSHASNFINDVQVIKIRERVALVIYRAAAFCKVTGI